MATKVPEVYYNQSPNEVSEIKSRWWLQPDEEIHRHVFGVVKKIWEYQRYRQLSHLRYARLYHNMEIVSLNSGMFARTAAQDNWLSNRVTLNVIKSCVDTATSKIAKSKSRPIYMTQDGNWMQQTKAKGMTKFVDGWFDEVKLYEKTRQAFVDAGVFGTGVIKVYPDETENKVKAERVIIDEIVVDEAEGRYGYPRQMHQVKLVFREVLAELYPDYKQEIMSANNGMTPEESSMCSADMLKVIESWHLPSTINSTDGKHAICIENCTLFAEDWERQNFPFAFFRWTPRILGFYGMSLAEELIGIQLEINKLLRNIQIAQHLMAVPQVWLEANSHVVTAHVNNEIGGVKRYVGTPPIFQVPPAMSSEIYQWLENLYQKAYRITGISEMSAQSQKPAGVTAAVAMRELSDIETDRFAVTAQRFDEFHLDIAELAIEDMDYLYEKDKSLSVTAADAKFMEEIKWRDVKMARDSYIVKSYPTNLLPTTPAGRLQKVQELIQAGIFDKEEALSLLDYPDVESVTSLKVAPREDILRMIYLMLYKGSYFTPEPFMNVQLALRLTQSAYNKARCNNAPEDRLQLLRDFMTDLNDKLQPPPPPPQMPGPTPDAQGQVPGAVPAGRAQKPPVSELMPFAAGGGGAPPT